MMRYLPLNKPNSNRPRTGAFFSRARNFVACVAALIATETSAQTRYIDIKPRDPNNRGQIAILDREGRTEMRLRGFKSPATITTTPEGGILVGDAGAREITSLARDGDQYTLRHTWKLGPEITHPVAVFPQDNNSLLVVDRAGALVKLDSNSAARIIAKAPTSPTTFSSAAPLPDGRLLLARPDGTSPSNSVKIFDPRDSSWADLSVQEMPKQEKLPPSFVATLGSSVYLWRLGLNTVIQGKIEGNTFIPAQAFHTPASFRVAPDNAGGLIHTNLEGATTHLSSSGENLSSFQFVNPPLAMGLTSDSAHIVLAHELPLPLSWPGVEDKLFGHSKVDFKWRSFLTWTVPALVGTLFWLTATALLARPQRRVSIQPPTSPSISTSSWRKNLGRALSLIAISGGLYLAVTSHQKLLSGLGREAWLPGYLIGAFLVAVAVESWRRRFPGDDEPDRFSTMIRLPAPRFSWSVIAPLSAMTCLAGYLYTLGIDRAHIGEREGVFCAGLILALGIIVREALECRHAIRSFIRDEAIFFIPPLLVGVVTFFYKLTEVPYNCHFDFTLNTFFAGQFLKGKVFGGWDWGYVPAPIIGTIPEMIGLLVGGWTPLGYRVGNSLFNISGIFAVYLLGRVYRNQRVGFWAALILAGNVPFIHFGRLQSNGSSATTALWGLALFALALKHKRTSLWLLTGLVCGFSFYQWPVARVGLTAVGCFYVLVLLRYPVTQVKQLPHLLAGAIGFALMLAPFIIMWQTHPERLMPRAQESLTGIRWQGTWFQAVAENPTVQLFYRSLGWIFNEYDRSSQGTMSPGFNSIEAILFACGLAILIIEGLSLNLLLASLLSITLLVCGAWAIGPPWYTRLLPTAPVACILIGRVLEGIHNLFRFGSRRLFWGLFALSACALVVVSPYTNFTRYVNYESALGRRLLAQPMVAIARKINSTGPEPLYVWLASGEPTWSFRHVPSFSVMLPYIHGFDMQEVYVLDDTLPANPARPTVFLVQTKRQEIDIPQIRQAHPNALVEDIKDINGDTVAIAVTVR